jgi:hypothetical protein
MLFLRLMQGFEARLKINFVLALGGREGQYLLRWRLR